MAEWIKWWKNKTYMTVLVIALVAMVIAGIFANCFTWGWIVSCASACIGGFAIRRVIVNKLNSLSEEEGGNG